MKTLKTLFSFMLVAAIGLSQLAFAGNSEKTEIRKVEGFTAIKVSSGIDLYLTMADKQEVKIVANNELMDEIITKVEGETLHIYMKKSNWFNWGRTGPRKAYVQINELNAIHASAGSDVRSENTLEGASLEVKSSSGSDVYLDVIYKNVSVDCSSGSDAKITGKAKYFDAEASSGSDIHAQDFKTQNAKLRASSGSDISVNVSDELTARASSGADIKYYGNPKSKNIDESSGGDVRGR